MIIRTGKGNDSLRRSAKYHVRHNPRHPCAFLRSTVKTARQIL